MSHYKTNMQLRIIDNLFIEREKELKELIGNLQIENVNNDQAYNNTLDRIKRQILLNSVSFEEPKISGHYQETRQVQQSSHNLFGGAQQVFVITIDFSFSGSEELFDVYPNNTTVPMGRIYQPVGHNVSVEVTIPQLDKEKAISEAKSLMSTTFTIINANSTQAENWSKAKEPLIESMLQEQSKKLLDFYS